MILIACYWDKRNHFPKKIRDLRHSFHSNNAEAPIIISSGIIIADNYDRLHNHTHMNRPRWRVSHHASLWNSQPYSLGIPVKSCIMGILWTQEGVLTTVPQCNCTLEFPEILSQNHIRCLGFPKWCIVGYSLTCPITLLWQ